jgi:hypothetical protein
MQDDLAKVYAGKDFQDALRLAEQIMNYRGPDDPRPLINVLIYFVALGVFFERLKNKTGVTKRSRGRPRGSVRKDPNDLKFLQEVVEPVAATLPEYTFDKILSRAVKMAHYKGALLGKDSEEPISHEATVDRLKRLKKALDVEPISDKK